MKPIKIFAIALIIAGILGLMYGKFSYTEETHDVKAGPIEFSIEEKKTVNIPQWLGFGGILLGGIILVTGKK